MSKPTADQIINHHGPMLTLQPRKRSAKDAVLIVDGTLVPTRDHTIAERSKNYRNTPGPAPAWRSWMSPPRSASSCSPTFARPSRHAPPASPTVPWMPEPPLWMLSPVPVYEATQGMTVSCAGQAQPYSA